jgi:hypothetical protein
MDKAGATTLPEALVRAQGEVPFADFIYGWSFYSKEVCHNEVLPHFDGSTYLLQ